RLDAEAIRRAEGAVRSLVVGDWQGACRGQDTRSRCRAAERRTAQKTGQARLSAPCRCFEARQRGGTAWQGARFVARANSRLRRRFWRALARGVPVTS